MGNVNTKIRERLWQRINENIGNGEATIAYNTNNEIGYTFRTTRKNKKVVSFDGIPLMMTLKNSDSVKHGFSKAAHLHRSRQFRMEHCHDNYDEITSYIALDIETTGLNASTDKIISIGAIKNIGKKEETLYELVKINHRVSSSIQDITGLNNAILDSKGITIKEALNRLNSFIGELPVVGYNLAFDQRFLRMAALQNNIKPITNSFVDLLGIVKQCNRFLDNYHLATTLKKYGITNNKPHNALSDAKATCELANKLIETGNLHL